MRKTEKGPDELDTLGLKEVLARPRRLFWVNFIAGLFRGLGFMIGLSVVGGLLLSFALYILKPAAKIPVLGYYFAQIFEAMEDNRRAMRQGRAAPTPATAPAPPGKTQTPD